MGRSILSMALLAIGFLIAGDTLGFAEETDASVHSLNDKLARDQEMTLKDVFNQSGKSEASDASMVGRIGVLLVKENMVEAVRMDYPFKNGDRFRFEITSNNPGTLYIHHMMPGQEWQQLWPRGNEHPVIMARQTYTVPPSPAAFRFDKETGQEIFCVSIRSDDKQQKPSKSAKTISKTVNDKGKNKKCNKNPSNEITNFYIRDPFGGASRGITYDPGTDKMDSSVYFSSVPGDGRTSASFQFQLLHKD